VSDDDDNEKRLDVVPYIGFCTAFPVQISDFTILYGLRFAACPSWNDLNLDQSITDFSSLYSKKCTK
jgi:hypothetical protein